MKIDYNTIKNELQGHTGLIKVIRERHLPDTVAMASLAQKKYVGTGKGYKNVDFALDELLRLEYEIYLEKQKAITESFIEFVDLEASKTGYPNLRKVIDEYRELSKKQLNPTTILKGITNIIIALAESNRQSGVTRAGASLMNHIAFLLEKWGFIFEEDFQREFYVDPKFKNSKLDFFFPSLDMFQNEPKNCCAVSCQTTSNDRYRLAFAQVPKTTRNRACTAIGSKNFGDKLGPKSLTSNKLQDAKQKGIKFVVLGSAIDKRLKDSKTVMSYQEWFKELKTIRKFW